MTNDQRNHLLVYIAVAMCIALEIPIECAPAQSAISEVSRQVRVQGTVTDTRGRPLKGAAVLVEQIPFPDSPTHEFRNVETSVDGLYEFDLNLKAGEVVPIRAYKTGFSIAQTTVLEDHDLPGDKSVWRHDFRLASSQPLVCRLADSDGQPVVGACLATISESKLVSLAYPWLLPEVLQRLGLELPKSDANGLVEISWLSAGGVYQIGFDHPEFARGMHWNARLPSKPQEVIMERGEEAEFVFRCSKMPAAVRDARARVSMRLDKGFIKSIVPVDQNGRGIIRVVKGWYVSLTPLHPTLATTGSEAYKGQPMTFSLYEKATLRGRVLNFADHEGVAGIDVHVSLQVNQRSTVASTKTASDGSFSITVPATSLLVQVSRYVSSMNWTPEGEVQVVEPDAWQIYELDDFFVRARLPLRGQVLVDDQPVPQAIVHADFSPRNVVVADAQGRFELRTHDLLGGRGSIVTAIHPLRPLSQVVHADDQQQGMLIQLSTDGSLVGRVVDSQGHAVANQCVNLQTHFEMGNISVQSAWWQSTRSRNDGTFRLQGLSAGFKYRAVLPVKDASNERGANGSTVPWKEASAPNSHRSQLIISEELRQMIELSPVAEPTMPAKLPRALVERKLKTLNDSPPLSPQAFEGKLVLLCYNTGVWQDLLKVLEQVHLVYAPHKLTVIAVFHGDSQREVTHIETFLKGIPVDFHMATDDGSLAKLIPGARISYCALYGADGLLMEEIDTSQGVPYMLPIIRHAIVYQR